MTKPFSSHTYVGFGFIRSDFVRRSYDNDIALVRMDKEVTFNLLVRPVCLPSMVDEMAGMEGDVAEMAGMEGLAGSQAQALACRV